MKYLEFKFFKSEIESLDLLIIYLAAMLVRTIPANGVLFGLVESTEPIIKRTLFN